MHDASSKEIEKFIRKSGYQIRGKNQKESIVINIDGQDHLSCIEADYTVSKDKKDYVVVVRRAEFDPIDPQFRKSLIELTRVFSPHAVLLLDMERKKIEQVRFRFPREKSIDAFFNFLISLFIILAVIGIIWILVQIKLL